MSFELSCLCSKKKFLVFWFFENGQVKNVLRNELVTLGIVRVKNRNETVTEELLRNESVTFWRNVTNSLRIVPAVPV